MAVFESDLMTYLGTAASSVTIRPMHVPESTSMDSNAVVAMFEIVSSDHLYNLSGAAGQCTKEYQFHFASTDFLSTLEAAETVRLALQGYNNRTMGSTFVYSSLLEDESLEYDSAESGSDYGFYILTVTYRIKYAESIPTFS